MLLEVSPHHGRVASGARPGQGALRLLRCASALRVTERVPAAQMPLWAVFDGLWLYKGGAESAPRNCPQIYQGRQIDIPTELIMLARDAPTPRSDLPDFMPECIVSPHIGSKGVSDFIAVLERATNEHSIQEFLEANPAFLLTPLVAHHRGWVIPQKRLGSEHITDFLACGLSSLGLQWLAIEIESPVERLFTQKGDPTAPLTHAIRQISDWREWLTSNLSYARNPKELSGLGLRNITAEVPGLILMGRSSSTDASTHHRRQRLSIDLNINIRTYDYLIDAVTNPHKREL